MQPTERCLTEKVEALSLKVDEQNELIQLNANDVRYDCFLYNAGNYINELRQDVRSKEG